MNPGPLIPIPIQDSQQRVHARATFPPSATMMGISPIHHLFDGDRIGLGQIKCHLIIPLIFTLVVSMTTAATALPLSGRRLTGMVRKVDWQAKEAEVSIPETGQSIIFTWNRQTQFLANGQNAGSGILKPEAMIKVIHHQPFFGRSFVSRVTLLSTPGEILRKGSDSMAKPNGSCVFTIQRPRSLGRFLQSPSNSK